MSLPVKLCCMCDRAEVDLAIDAGATVLGFVGEQPSGPGRLEDDAIADLIAYVDGRVSCWLLTSTVTWDALRDQITLTRPNAVQICDEVDVEIYANLRRDFPHIQLIQVVHVACPAAAANALRVAPYVDAVLLDSGITTGPNRQLGGTGCTHDWRLSRAIVDASPVPVWLAGGLSPQNVETAIRQVRPAGVDLCTGVRDANYHLDPAKVESFMRGVQVGSSPLELSTGASMAQLQHYVQQLEAHHDWLHVGAVENGFLMVEEVGELHKALRTLNDKRARSEPIESDLEDVGDEIVDVLNYLLAQANRLGIDVEEAFRRKNTRNLGRSWS
ncbi:MAG: hypothetical protein AB8H79_15955 [Myxococcota bacterium]